MTAEPPAPTPLGAGVGVAQRLLDLLFPLRCVHCGTPGAPLCAVCFGAITAPPAPRCHRCDRPLFAALGPLCPLCMTMLRQAERPALERIVVAADYDGPAGSAIRALKFRRQRRLAPPLALLLTDAARRAGLTPDVVLPMPLHAERRRERGYNQAELLAGSVAHALRAPMAAHALERTRATRPQTRLSRHERHLNVAGAFALASPMAAAQLAGKRIALVDDVTTTGATLEAAADALLDARPAVIWALAVARPVRWSDGPDDATLDR